MAKKAKKGPKSLWDKVADIDHDFAVRCNSATDVELKDNLINLQNNDERVKKAREADDDLKRIRNELTVANQTYSEPLKASGLKKQLIIQTLQERGRLEA